MHASAATILWLCAGALPADGWRDEVRALELEGELDRALARVEVHLEGQPEDVEAWRWLAETLERLVTEGGRDAWLFSDAGAAWERVAELAPAHLDAPYAAARARLAAGELDAAADLAASVAGLPRLGDGASAEARAARARWLLALDLGDVAREELRTALAGDPGSVVLHRTWIDLHLALALEQELPQGYALLAAAYPDEAPVRWYQGYGARLAGDLASRERRNDEALELYAQAITALGTAAAAEPAYAESALWVEMQARTAAGWSALDGDDVARAEREWMAVLESAPEFAQRPDGLGRSATQGLGRLGGRHHVRDDIGSAQRVSRAVAEATDEAWSWNNVGYLLREIASDTEASGDPAAFDLARTAFQESYRSYLRAAELAPHEPRIVNDTALIQVYHLQEDLDRAERMLLEAIRVGEGALAELGPEPDERERFPLAQAVGDAYQNLGFLYYRLRNDPRAAREYFVRSVETDSGARRGVVASILAIDAGEGAAGPERRIGTPPAPPPPPAEVEPPSEQESRESTGQLEGQGLGGASGDPPAEYQPRVRWERSLAVALETAAHQGGLALAFHRAAGGVGPSVEYLQRALHSRHFEQATGGHLTVLADRLRHTFADRRRDGRLILCPRAGGVTCAEHIACAVEFEERYRRDVRPRLGLESNGLFAVSAEGLERIGRSQDTFERFRPGRDFDAATPKVAAVPEPPLTADPTVWASSRRLIHRRALEAQLFEAPEAAARHAALEAVVAAGGTDNDELLTAVARQLVDPELARRALEAWRPDLGSAAPRFALQANPDAAVRAAALMALARVGDGPARRAIVARWCEWRGGAPDPERDLSALAGDLIAD